MSVNDLPERAQRRLMRVSDTDRDQAAEVLREAAAQGRITLDELNERLDRTYAAKTYADLEIVTRDLPAADGAAPAVAPGGFPAERVGGTPGIKFAIAFMSGVRRSGRWVVPSHYTVVAVMGGVELDLREARFSQPEVIIQAYALMGGVSITVPEDIEVDVAGIGFMGGFDHQASGPGVPGAPRLKIIGFAMMGGVDVQRKPMKRRRQRPGLAADDDDRPAIED